MSRQLAGLLVIVVTALAGRSTLLAGTAQEPAAAAAETATITLHATACVGAGTIRLGQVADIAADKQLALKLSAVTLGLAPPIGSVRVISRGYIRLRLRRAKIDPSKLAFEGSEQVLVSQPAAVDGGRAEAATAGAARNMAGKQRNVMPLVRRGDKVVVVVQCGAVEVRAQGYCQGQGGAGDAVMVRITGTNRLLEARVVTAHEVAAVVGQ